MWELRTNQFPRNIDQVLIRFVNLLEFFMKLYALRNFVLLLQFKKISSMSVFHVFEFYKCHQIAQSITNM